MRRDERNALWAASPASPSSTSARISRLASTLVSGVRSSWEASATNCRCRVSIASVSARDSARGDEHLVERHGELADLVGGVRHGDAALRVARARDVACGDGQLRDGSHGVASHDQTGAQRQQRAAEHTDGQEVAHAVLRAGDVRQPPAIVTMTE